MCEENKIDKLIQECIDNLTDDNINCGAECLQELAQYFAKAGMTQQSFADTRTYIINEAKKMTCALFIDEKLKISEQALMEKRTGSVIIQTTH